MPFHDAETPNEDCVMANFRPEPAQSAGSALGSKRQHGRPR